jgi:hypothetical protein
MAWSWTSIWKNSWAQSSAWVDYLGLRSLVWTSLQSSWAWWRTKRSTVLVLWLEHWPHGTSCAVGMYEILYADPMRSHAFNQSIAELWRDQPPSCWTAPTGNVDSPLLPAESLSTTYYEFLEHLWHDVGGSKESFQTEKIPEDIEV